MWQFYSYIVFFLKFRVWGVTFEWDFSFFVYPRWFNLAHVTQTTAHQFPCSHRSPEICIRHEKSTTMTYSLMINHINTSEASTNTALHLNALFCCEFWTEILGSLVIAVFWFSTGKSQLIYHLQSIVCLFHSTTDLQLPKYLFKICFHRGI